jgi:anion-transporting  ArsA/GET3 family ATPase
MGPAEAVERQRLIVVCGPGGVGKTTTAAAFGLAAARRGRRALVLTIDPAKRLGESLGEASLGNDPVRVPNHLFDPSGSSTGELWALMLDQEQTADTLIVRHASSEEAARRVLSNRIYRVLVSALASTEYTAVERLWQLYTEGRFDLYVLDTPPSRNAIDFLDSPQWAARVLDQRIVTWFLRTARQTEPGEGIAQAVMYRTAMLVADLMGRLLGREFYDELTEFFEVFVDISEHLRDHSIEVDHLLRRPSTSFFVATSPEQGPIEEAIRMVKALNQRGITFGGFVVNRVEVPLVAPHSTTIAGYARQVGLSEDAIQRLHPALQATWQELQAVVARDEAAIRQLAFASRNGLGVHRVPRLGDDLAGILDLARFASWLVGTPRC